MTDAWVIVGPKGVAYLGLHLDEHEAWQIYLGWPDESEVAERKAKGWYAAKATLTWAKEVSE
jgi:hypothetical protein